MNIHDGATVALNSALGFAGGWILGGPTMAVVLFTVGAAFAVFANRFDIRTTLAVVVFGAALVGAIIGARVVHVLCLPGSCVAMETTAGVVTAIGAFIGVGLVAALVARSFDEYREETAKRDHNR